MPTTSFTLFVFAFSLFACQPPANSDKAEQENKPTEKTNQSNLSDEEVAEYQVYATKIRQEAQNALGQKLMQKVGESGAEGAIEFCNINAIPLTDSVANLNHVSLKRLTNRPRNPENKAEGKELEILKTYIRELDSGKQLQTVHQIEPKNINFYYPILTNSFCLNCHGEPKVEVNETTLAALAEKYPNDSALNYRENQLRGIWKISFPY